jgi:hypothetical protein
MAAQAKWKYTDRAARLEITVQRPGGAAVPVSDLLCWPFIGGRLQFCECDGNRAHILELCCPGAVNDALGAPKKRGCKKKDCPKRHPATDEVMGALEAWHLAKGLGKPVIGHSKAPVLRVIAGASAATASSLVSTGSGEPLPSSQPGGDHAEGVPAGEAVEGGHRQSAFQLRGQKCSVPVDVVRSRLQSKADGSPYVARFLQEPFFEAMLADDRLRQLLTARKAAKEISESYGIADRVMGAMRTITARKRRQARSTAASAAVEGNDGADEEPPFTGAGFVVLDVCSGKGFASVLMSLLVPEASVVMLDADGGMDLSHVAARPNLTFEPLDLFSDDAPFVVERLARAGPTTSTAEVFSSTGKGGCVVMGMHLCGALSPRLATVCCRLPCVDALIVCPCCLKGGLGGFVQREAKAVSQAGAKAGAKAGTTAGAKEAAEGAAMGAANKGSNDAVYQVLVGVLANLCREERTGNPEAQTKAVLLCGACTAVGDAVGDEEVAVQFDRHVMSPKNGFISMIKSEHFR